MAKNFVLEGQNDAGCGDGSCDSIRLQALLDTAPIGAVIELRGTFNFGSDQFVTFKKDVTITGKNNGKNKTIIKGGMNSFALGWDPAFGFPEFDHTSELISYTNTERWPGEFVIENIQFENPTWSAISVAAATGLSILNNSFIGGQQIDTGCNAYGFDPPDGSMYPVCVTTRQDARHPTIGAPSDITGHIRVEKNYFDGRVVMDPDGFDPVHGASSLLHGEPILENGMLSPIMIDGTEASINIEKNEFENIVWGVSVRDNSGSIIIAENKIFMNPKDERGNPIGFVWAGIDLQNFGERVNHAKVRIEKNYIYSNVRDFIYGIMSGSKDATITGNILELDQPPESLWNAYGDSAGIKVLPESANNMVSKNTIKGSGQSAIVLEGRDENSTSLDNTVSNNNVDEFTPLDIIDAWCRVEGGDDCPTVPGSHYHITDFTLNNHVVDKSWSEGMILVDDTSDFNPYDPATYNGDNKIELGK